MQTKLCFQPESCSLKEPDIERSNICLHSYLLFALQFSAQFFEAATHRTVRAMRLHASILFLASLLVTPCASFLNTQHHGGKNRRTFVSQLQRQILFDDFEDFAMNDDDDKTSPSGKQKRDGDSSSALSSSGGSSSVDVYSALRARQAEFESGSPDMDYSTNVLEDEEQLYIDNWRTAQCSSTVRLTLGDWIRRIAIDNYPLAVCGTAGGHLYLADLQEGEELDCLLAVHVSRNEDLTEEPTMEMLEALDTLFGQYDGGGVISLAMKDDFIVSSGREGGAFISRIVGREEQVYRGSRGGTSKQTKLSLQRVGRFRSLKSQSSSSDAIITAIAFDDAGSLWLGGFDGILRCFDYEERNPDDKPSMLSQTEPLHSVDLGDPIVSISLQNELGCGVASTTEGAVIFSLEDGEIIGKWNPLVKKVRKEFVRSAILLKDDSDPATMEGDPATWSVVCGGSKGSMFQRKLNVDRTGSLSDTRPFLDQVSKDDSVFPIKMRPNHVGAVVMLASPSPGLLVSGALDGSMRVWDYAEHDDEEDVYDEDGDETEAELEAQYDDIQPNDSRPQCLYALSGYKVWLGSIFASSRKLVSDGADNTIIVHSFENEEEVLFSEDDDDDDIEGFYFE